jgi:AraC-like DNA-binding protein
LHVVACLPRHLLAHLRIVVGDTHSLAAATDPAELHSMLRVGDADLLIIDPAMRDGGQAEAIEDIIARHASLPVVVYTTLTPMSMRHVMRLARLGVQHVVLNRFDDEPRRFLDLIERVPAHPVAELMLRELAEPLRLMPVVLARAVEQLVRSPSRARTIPDFAAMAGMTSRTLYRHLTPMGLPPRQLLIGARLLRAYIFLRGPDSRLKEVAVKLGYAQPEQLSEQLRDWTGLAAKDIRRTLTPTEFVRRIADHLRRVGAEAEDEVEPV